MLSSWLVSATLSSSLCTLCPTPPIRGARGTTLRGGPDGGSHRQEHFSPSNLQNKFFPTCGTEHLPVESSPPPELRMNVVIVNSIVWSRQRTFATPARVCESRLDRVSLRNHEQRDAGHRVRCQALAAGFPSCHRTTTELSFRLSSEGNPNSSTATSQMSP